jgi:hypothetical protein
VDSTPENCVRVHGVWGHGGWVWGEGCGVDSTPENCDRAHGVWGHGGWVWGEGGVVQRQLLGTMGWLVSGAGLGAWEGSSCMGW